MKNFKSPLNAFVLLMSFMFVIMGCSESEPIDEIIEQENIEEVTQSTEIDQASTSIDDISLSVFEVQEASELTRNPSNNRFDFLPNCVTVTVFLEQDNREVTIDFGTDGCEIRGNVLKGIIVLSYTRNPDLNQLLITKSFDEFYFNGKNIIGEKSILRERSNENGNPQFTKTVDITFVWPNGAEASREGTKIREWLEGHGSGVWSDNVYTVTGNWTTTFRNGNLHSYVVSTPLRREAVCRFFVSGTLNIMRTNTFGVFDYGTGECDNQATFTSENGTVREITLR